MPTWFDRLLHPSLRADPDRLPRARLTVQLTVVLIGAALVYALFYGAVVGFVSGAIVLVAGAGVAAITLAALRVRPWLGAGGYVLLGVVYAVLVALTVRAGGLASPVTAWLITPPIFAILLLGRRGTLAWTALSVLTVVALHVAEESGVRFPVDYPEAWAARVTFASYAGLMACTAILMFVFEGIRAAAQARAERASAQLARLAYHDALTGLANRARFVDCLDRVLARASVAGTPESVAVLLLDLDGFKGVNDSMGHATGDALLAQVAKRLLNATRGCDTVARLGGDEFAVLIDGVRQDADLEVVADRIVAAISTPFAIGTRRASIGASVGIARAARPAAAAVLHDADVAMYRAKALGRGRWVAFERTTAGAA